MKLPAGWSQLELTRHTPHGDFVVTLYDDGEVITTRWLRGEDATLVKKCGTFEDAILFCETDLFILDMAALYATCGAVNVDADGREVPESLSPHSAE